MLLHSLLPRYWLCSRYSYGFAAAVVLVIGLHAAVLVERLLLDSCAAAALMIETLLLGRLCYCCVFAAGVD